MFTQKGLNKYIVLNHSKTDHILSWDFVRWSQALSEQDSFHLQQHMLCCPLAPGRGVSWFLLQKIRC